MSLWSRALSMSIRNCHTPKDDSIAHESRPAAQWPSGPAAQRPSGLYAAGGSLLCYEQSLALWTMLRKGCHVTPSHPWVMTPHTVKPCKPKPPLYHPLQACSEDVHTGSLSNQPRDLTPCHGFLHPPPLAYQIWPLFPVPIRSSGPLPQGPYECIQNDLGP
jgi:hypothetical protein